MLAGLGLLEAIIIKIAAEATKAIESKKGHLLILVGDSPLIILFYTSTISEAMSL